MDTNMLYSEQLETRLITKFREQFHEKLGYYPVVIAKSTSAKRDAEQPWTLEDLAVYFQPYLPMRFSKIVELTSPLRIREIVELRMIFCAIARGMGFTCKSIGCFLGNRDHTTVIHAVNTYNDLMFSSESFRDKYYLITSDIQKDFPHDTPTMDDTDPLSSESEPALLP